MLIGTRISPDWLERPDDLRFLKQIGVGVVDITMSPIPGYDETGRLSGKGSGAPWICWPQPTCASSASTRTGDMTHQTFLGLPGDEEELDNLAHNTRVCCDFGLEAGRAYIAFCVGHSMGIVEGLRG